MADRPQFRLFRAVILTLLVMAAILALFPENPTEVPPMGSVSSEGSMIGMGPAPIADAGKIGN